MLSNLGPSSLKRPEVRIYKSEAGSKEAGDSPGSELDESSVREMGAQVVTALGHC